KVTDDNAEAVEQSDFIILCVKPWLVSQVHEDMRPFISTKKHVIISVAAGISINFIESIIGKDFSIIRLMPNTAIAVRESMTAITPSAQAKPDEIEFVTSIFEQLGQAMVIEEKLMD